MDLSRRYFLELLGLAGTGMLLDNCGAGIQQEKFTPLFPQTTSRGKAVIINGDDSEFRHLENVIRAERFLLGIGYGNKDISVLSPPYEAFTHEDIKQLRKTAEFGGGFALPTIQGPATTKNVEVTLDKLVEGIGAEQELFVYITGHGGVDEKTKASVAQLNAPFAKWKDDELSDRRLKEILTKGNKRYNGVVIFDGCNGEGFADVVGGGNITAITKSKKGQEDSCIFFANELFHMPFYWNLKEKGQLRLRDAVEYTARRLERGGAEAHIVMNGGYNPILREVIDAQPMMFSVFMPNSPVQRGYMSLMSQLKYDKKVKIVEDEKMYAKALAEPQALLYVQADECGSCRIMSGLLAERLEEIEKRVPIYVFANGFNADKVEFNDYTQRLENDLGIHVTSVPLLLRSERGKIVSALNQIPAEVFGYGNLPDRYITIPSRAKMDRMLMF